LQELGIVEEHTWLIFVVFWQYWGLNQGFTFARQALYPLSQASSPFGSGYLEIGSCFLPKFAWTSILLFHASCHHWVIDTCHHT
jgi:hypothetical protein